MNTRLVTFILVSLLAHATLLFWRDTPPRPQLAIGGQAQALQVTLAASPQAVTTRKEITALEATVAKPAATRPPLLTHSRPTPPGKQPLQTPAGKPEKMPQLEHDTVGKPAPAVATATAEQASSVTVSERISAALQNRLSKRFEYPWLARKRGWQGQVTLSLQVEDNGNLTHWKVSKTSGHALLDRSALKAARGIGRLQEADKLLNGESLKLLIPVHYRLLDS